jgi:CheY-like chemotaxis protein
MDISMPMMDGLCATRIIRKFDQKRRIPIIAVTAFDQAFHQKALDAGCDCVIGKPLDFDTFENFLGQYFEY